ALLQGVSCTAADACVAVGFNSGSWTTSATLIEGWDGNTWSIQAAPSPGTMAGFRAVFCPAAGACVATGASDNATLVEETRTLAGREPAQQSGGASPGPRPTASAPPPVSPPPRGQPATRP